MEEYVVANPTARDEGGLGTVYDLIQRAPQTQHHDLGHEFEVTVQQGDGSVAVRVIRSLVPSFVQQHNEAGPAALRQLRSSRRGGKRLIEGCNHGPREDGPELAVKLIRQPITTRALAFGRSS